MIKEFSLCALSLFLLISPVYAKNIGSTEITYATGEKSQTDAIEDRDLSGSFSFHKYSVSVKARPQEDFYYRISARNYKKHFDTSQNNLDNRTNIYSARLSAPIYKSEENSLGFSTDYELRRKRYKNSPSLEYDENSLSSGLDIDFYKNYSLKFSGGIRDYDYIKYSPSNQLKSFFKVNSGIKFPEKDLTISGYYRKDWVDQSEGKKDYTEDLASIRTSLGFDMPVFYKLSGHFEGGRDDTRESAEDREDNLRFKYRLWDITTCHKLTKAIDTQFSYGQKYRGYFTSINSYDSYFITNDTEYLLFEKEAFKLEFLCGGEHKESKFYENEKLNYKKNSVSGGFNMLKRADWSLKPSFKFSDYDYPPLSVNNQKSCKIDVGLKKYIGSTDNAFDIAYWHNWKDYRYKSDVREWSMNLSLEFKF